MEEGPIRRIEKVWGDEIWWVNEPEYCLKVLTLEPGFTSSLHYHRKKKETFLVRKGRCHLLVRKKDKELVYNLGVDAQVTISPGQPHQFWLESDAEEPCQILEVSTHHSEDDVVRLDESRRI